MATESKWEVPASIATVSWASGDINSLADGANALSAKIDNVADGENELFISLELYLAAQGSSRDADARCEIYVLFSVDDTNFDMGDNMFDPRPESLIAVMSFPATTTARYRTAVNLPLGPYDFKLLIMNETGQALAASNNTLKYRLHSAESQ